MTDPVTPADVRAFAARACAAHIRLSAVDQEEYERLRSKLFAAVQGDPHGIDRIAAVTRAVKTCLTPGRTDDQRATADLRRAVDSLINHLA